MNILEYLLTENFKKSLVSSVIIIIVSIILYKLSSYLIERIINNPKHSKSENKKRNTYLKLIRSIIRYVFIAITILILLQENGININSVLTGVGILGVIFGLAIQDWLKDIIRGSSILSDSYFNVGDVIKYNDIEGKVLVIGLKTTKIQSLKDGNIISIANRQIEHIEVLSNILHIDIPMPYEVSLEQAEKAIADIINSIKHNNNVKECKYMGVNEFADSSIKYMIEIHCNPVYKLQTRRDALRSILVELKNNSIDIPYTQIDIHEK